MPAHCGSANIIYDVEASEACGDGERKYSCNDCHRDFYVNLSFSVNDITICYWADDKGTDETSVAGLGGTCDIFVKVKEE